MVLTYSIRVLLHRRNIQRANEPHDTTYDDVYVIQRDSDGNEVEVKISKVRLLALSRLFS